MAEKYWSGVKGLALNLYASGNGSLCLGTTDHHDTHATLLRLRRCSSGTGLARRNDEATVIISRQCKGARKSVIIGTNSAALGHARRFEREPSTSGLAGTPIPDAESNTLPSVSLATLSTKGTRQGIRCRCGEPPNKQGLPSRFGFVDTGELALYPAEQNESQRGKSDRICESF